MTERPKADGVPPGGSYGHAPYYDKNTRLLSRGSPGAKAPSTQSRRLLYGTTSSGALTPGKGGTDPRGWPGVQHRRRLRQGRPGGANASVIFVPPPGGADAVLEAADAGLPLAVCITEGIPTLDMLRVFAGDPRGQDPRDRAELSGPDYGRAGQSRYHSGNICKEGRVGIVSKSGTLTYEAIHQLTKNGPGARRRASGIGGDPLIGTSFIDALSLFANDPATEAVVMIGEIGGNAEKDAAGRGSRRTSRKPGRRLHRRPDGAAGRRMGTPGRSSRAARDGGGENGGAHGGGRAGRQEPGGHRRGGQGASEGLMQQRIVNDFSIQVATVNGSGARRRTSSSALHLPDGHPGVGQEHVPVEHRRAADVVHGARQQGRLHRAQEGSGLPRRDERRDGERRRHDARAGRAVVYDEPLKLNELRTDLTFYPVPFDKIVAGVCTDAKLRRLVKNMIYPGVLSQLLGIDMGEMEKATRKQFGKKVKAAGPEHRRAEGRRRVRAAEPAEAGSRSPSSACTRPTARS
jgi:succinyl-CoA synthetase alpha subunit